MLISLEVCQRPMAEALWAVAVSLFVVFCAIAGATQRAEPMTATARYLVNMVFSCKRCVLPAINSQAAKAFTGLAKKGPRFAIRQRHGLFRDAPPASPKR